MKKRQYFLLSWALAVLGLCAHIQATRCVIRSLSLRARSVTWSEPERLRAKAEADVQLQRAPLFEYPSIAFAVLSAVFLVFSARRQEPAWRSVPFALLLVYVMSHFLII